MTLFSEPGSRSRWVISWWIHETEKWLFWAKDRDEFGPLEEATWYESERDADMDALWIASRWPGLSLHVERVG